jgi:hypothetical protein
VDGTGTAWDMLDGWAYRINGTGPDSTFNAANWKYSGIDALDNELTNANAKKPFPIHTFKAIGGGGGSPGPSPSPSLPPPPPALPIACTSIMDLQAAAMNSVLGGKYLACGWVTRVVYNGFFMQQVASQLNPVSSSGIFVYTAAAPANLANGDAVEVTGVLAVYNSLIELTVPVVKKTLGAPKTFTPVSLSVPVANMSELVVLQSMLVSVYAKTGNSVVVSEYYNLDQYGEFIACAADTGDSRMYQYSVFNAPDISGYTAHVAGLKKVK